MSNLRRVIRGFLLEDLVDGEELLIGPNRTNALFVDLVIRRSRTTITKQVRTSQFLIQHHPHLTTDHRDNIELGINQIVTIKLLLLVNGGGLGGTLQQTEDLLFLVLTLDVTLSTGFVLSQIGIDALDTSERNMMNAIHNGINPVHIAGNHNRLLALGFRIGEQQLNVINAMLQGVIFDALFQAAVTLAIFQALVQDFSMHQSVVGLLAVGRSIKSVVSHSIFLLISSRIFIEIIGLLHIRATLLQSSTNDRVESIFLVLVKFCHAGLHQLGNGLFSFLLSHGFILLSSVTRTIIGMFENQLFVGANNGGLTTLIRMLHHINDGGTRIRTSQNQTNFSNDAVKNIRATLFQLIGTNRQGIHITMLDEQFSVSTLLSVFIELTVSVDSIFPVLQIGVAKDVKRVVMLVIPNKGNPFAIIVFECITSNYSAVGALQVVFGCPATEVVFLHFDAIPPSLYHQPQNRTHPEFRPSQLPTVVYSLSVAKGFYYGVHPHWDL